MKSGCLHRSRSALARCWRSSGIMHPAGCRQAETDKATDPATEHRVECRQRSGRSDQRPSGTRRRNEVRRQCPIVARRQQRPSLRRSRLRMESASGFPKMDGAPVIADSKTAAAPSRSRDDWGRSPSSRSSHCRRMSRASSWNRSPSAIQPTSRSTRPAFHCGFAKHLREGETWSPDASESPLLSRALPPRDQRADAGVPFAGSRRTRNDLCRLDGAGPSDADLGAEGWVWSNPSEGSGAGVRDQGTLQNLKSQIPGPHPNPLPKGEGTTAFLIAKFNPDTMEWSLMEPLKRGAETVLRFGGAGQWKHGHPEGSTRLEPGKSYRFGETRLQAVDGDWKQAYYAYRGYVEARAAEGRRTTIRRSIGTNSTTTSISADVCGMCDEYFFKSKRGFCPEFYEKNKKLLNQYYTLDLMKAEAAKAKEIGCERSIWTRLGHRAELNTSGMLRGSGRWNRSSK